jgi:DNA-binding XRE family transcriptional regulator
MASTESSSSHRACSARREEKSGQGRLLGAELGCRLTEIRRHRGLTQADVAARMGVGTSRINQIEKGKVSTRDVLAGT